jgi:hypothetical protein
MPAETPAQILQRHERLLRQARARTGGGAPGAQGPAGTVTVGPVTTGDPGTPAAVDNTGTPEAAVLAFTIPRGDKGDPGPAIDPASEQTFARLRLTSTSDLSLASTGHALQIGATDAQHLAMDVNEIGSKAANGTAWAGLTLYEPRAFEQGTTADSLTRRDFVETLRQEASAPWSTGWGAWGDGVYRDLRFWITRDGMVHCSGLARYNGGTGASTQICALTGNYVPRDGLRDILTCDLNDAVRFVNVQASGLFLRGALPAVGNFLAINGSWPGPLASV